MSTIGFDINQLGNIWLKAWESLGHDFLKDKGAAICAMNTINKCMIFIKKKIWETLTFAKHLCNIKQKFKV